MSKSSVTSNEVIDLFARCLAGDETQYDGLVPFHQDQARKFESVVAEAKGMLRDAEHDVARTWIIKAYFDAVQQNENWRDTGWGAKPKRQYILPRVELGQVPHPELFTIPSPSSSNTKIILVSFRTINRRGFGDPYTAYYYEVGEYDDVDKAERQMWELKEAFNFLLFDLPELVANGDQIAEKKNGGRWSDMPDF